MRNYVEYETFQGNDLVYHSMNLYEQGCLSDTVSEAAIASI